MTNAITEEEREMIMRGIFGLDDNAQVIVAGAARAYESALTAAEARNRELEEALEPFAKLGDKLLGDENPVLGQYIKVRVETITWGGVHDILPVDLRRARSAMGDG